MVLSFNCRSVTCTFCIVVYISTLLSSPSPPPHPFPPPMLIPSHPIHAQARASGGMPHGSRRETLAVPATSPRPFLSSSFSFPAERGGAKQSGAKLWQNLECFSLRVFIASQESHLSLEFGTNLIRELQSCVHQEQRASEVVSLCTLQAFFLMLFL